MDVEEFATGLGSIQYGDTFLIVGSHSELDTGSVHQFNGTDNTFVKREEKVLAGSYFPILIEIPQNVKCDY